jgi:proteasome lid subunit RPN8/RPN11
MAHIMTDVVVHPLVLLSVADHFNRVASSTNKRVVGVLLGTRSGSSADITNSFAVPFEEKIDNPTVWFLDHNFLDTMYWMFKKVNTREQIIGFYSTGPKIKENDLKISGKFKFTHFITLYHPDLFIQLYLNIFIDIFFLHSLSIFINPFSIFIFIFIKLCSGNSVPLSLCW